MNLCDGLFGRGGETRRGPPSYRLLEQGRKVQGVEKREGRGVGANVDSNPSGGEPSTERFISTRSPPLLAREHPPPPVPPPLHVRVSARGIKFGREAVSNILCSDSPTLSFAPYPAATPLAAIST